MSQTKTTTERAVRGVTILGPFIKQILTLAFRPSLPVLLERATGIDKSEIAEQTARDLGGLNARDPGDRGDDRVSLLPGIVALVGSKCLAPNDLETLPELVLQFALPLECQVRRRDD